MYENIGSKVKGLAAYVAGVGIVASVITGLIFCISRIRGSFLIGLICMVVGSLMSWIGSWVLYAIGRAAEVAELNEYSNRMLLALYNEMTDPKKRDIAEITTHEDEDARRRASKSGYDVG